MDANPKIFISTVTKEMKTARAKVAETLRLLHFEPIIQEEFPAHTGVVRPMLEKELAPCAAVIQIVGHRYGWDVYGAADPTQVMSYTHYEAHYAHLKPIPIWYLVINEDYQVDAPNDEEPNKKMLQAAYRVKVAHTGHLYHSVSDIKDVELTVFRMWADLDQLRPREFQQLPLLEGTSGQSLAAPISPVARTIDPTEMEKMMRSLFSEFVPALQQTQQGAFTEDEARKEEELYIRLGSMLGKTPEEARVEIQTLARKTESDLEEPLLERAMAAYALKDYPAAESLALEAVKQAVEKSPTDIQTQVEALLQAGRAAEEQIRYESALSHYRTAADLIDEEQDVLKWAEIQYGIGRLLHLSGRYDAQETLMHQVWQICKRAGHEEEIVSLCARRLWALALNRRGKSAAAEREFKPLLDTQKRVLGPEHPDTLMSRNNLANAMHLQGKYLEAEREYRAVFNIRERVLGPEHPDTLMSRNNLANVMYSQRKHLEAEREHGALLAIRERVLGPEHPDTLMSRGNLSNVMNSQGKYRESEREYRAVLGIYERILGPEHPDVFLTHHNLALCLRDQGKESEALEYARTSFKGWNETLGDEHPYTQDAKQLLADLEQP